MSCIDLTGDGCQLLDSIFSPFSFILGETAFVIHEWLFGVCFDWH